MIRARTLSILALSFFLVACSASKKPAPLQSPSLGSNGEEPSQNAFMLINHRYSLVLSADGKEDTGWGPMPKSELTLFSPGKFFIWGLFQLENKDSGNCMHFDTAVGGRERTCQTSSHEQTFGFIPSTNGSVQIFSLGANSCLGARPGDDDKVGLVVVNCVADLTKLNKVVPNDQLWRLAPLLRSSRRL